MKKSFVYFIFLTIIMTSQVLAGTVYYVDATNGDDSDTGTSSDHAWKTLSKVNSSSFNAGDWIYFKKGEEWRETLLLPSSGSSGNPIIFGAYGIGADPIINGADLVKRWTQYDTNIWQATCTTQPNQVFFNGIKGNKQISRGNVDSDKDWYWSSNTLYVRYPTDPDGLSNPGVEAATRDKGIYINGYNYITIDGINVTKGNSIGIAADNSTHDLMIKNCDVSYIALYGIYFDSTVGNSCTVDNCDVSYCQSTAGIYADRCSSTSGNESYIKNCTIHHNGYYGIMARCNYWIIESNDVHDNGQASGNSAGIGIYSESGENSGTHNIVRYNKSYNQIWASPDGEGIALDKTTGNNEIYYNLCYNNGGNGITVYDSDHNNIYNNVCYGNNTSSTNNQRAEIALSSSASDLNDHNTIKNNTGYAIGTGYAITVDELAKDNTNNSIDSNCWYKSSGDWYVWGLSETGDNLSTWNGKALVVTDLNSDPLITDPANGDFTLQAGSPCIDAGTNVGLTQDYAGNTVPYGCCVDIGAFEFIGSPSHLNTEISASHTSGVIPLTVNFTGNATGGSSPYSFSWDFGDGESFSSEQNPSHTYTAEGNYTVNLTVIDSQNSQASDSIIITATAPTEPLSVSASASPTSGQVPLAVSFSASAIGGVSPYSYNWDFGDGGSSPEQNPSYTYNQAGTYNVILTVTDSESSQATDSLTIEASSNPTFTLNISSITGSPAPGSGGTTDPDPGNHSYSQGTSVQVKALPNSDYRFSKWSGDVSSSNAYDKEIYISMDKDKSISAYFFTKCGDVNGDLSITAADAQWAFDIYLGRIADPTESEQENADVTCDGTATSPNVTPADAHAIFEKFIGRNELPCDCSCKSRTASYQAQTSEVRGVAIFVDSILFNESNEIVVPVAVDKPFNIHTFGFDLVYPSDVLEFVAVEESEEIKDYFMVDANKIADGVIRAGGFRKSFNLIHNPRTLIKLIFRVKEEARGAIFFNITNTVDDIKNASFRSKRIEEKKIGYRR